MSDMSDRDHAVDCTCRLCVNLNTWLRGNTIGAQRMKAQVMELLNEYLIEVRSGSYDQQQHHLIGLINKVNNLE